MAEQNYLIDAVSTDFHQLASSLSEVAVRAVVAEAVDVDQLHVLHELFPGVVLVSLDILPQYKAHTCTHHPYL